MSQTLLEMAKDLVLAQIEAHRLSPEDMHQALQHTHTSLLALKAQEDAHGSVAIATPETLSKQQFPLTALHPLPSMSTERSVAA